MRPGKAFAGVAVAALVAATWFTLRDTPAPASPAVVLAAQAPSSSVPAPVAAQPGSSALAGTESLAAPVVAPIARRAAAELAIDAPSRSSMGEFVEVAIRLQTVELPRRITFGLEYDATAFHLRDTEKGDFVVRSAGPMRFEVDETVEGRLSVTAHVAPDASLRDGGAVAIVRLEPILPAASTLKLAAGLVVPRSAGSMAIATPSVERSVVVF